MFMRPQTLHGDWFWVDTTRGAVLIPKDICPTSHPEDILPFTEAHSVDEIISVEEVHGWAARLSAPGYLDCTDWTCINATEEEALDELQSIYAYLSDEEYEELRQEDRHQLQQDGQHDYPDPDKP